MVLLPRLPRAPAVSRPCERSIMTFHSHFRLLTNYTKATKCSNKAHEGWCPALDYLDGPQQSRNLIVPLCKPLDASGDLDWYYHSSGLGIVMQSAVQRRSETVTARARFYTAARHTTHRNTEVKCLVHVGRLTIPLFRHTMFVDRARRDIL